MSTYTITNLPFREIWLVDFEFCAGPGDIPRPVCLVAQELRTGRVIRLWQDEFGTLPPYATGPDTLFVAYYASAEIGCHLALRWPAPARVLDLFAEFRCLTNGLPVPSGSGLIGALAYHGIDTIGASEKEDMRNLILAGGPWSSEERAAILDYCESDVRALARLLPVMLPRIDLPRALLRGRYMISAARIERAGVPIDTEILGRLRRHWRSIHGRLIEEIDADYGIFEGQTFKTARFAAWLARTRIPWPSLPSGALNLSDDTFRDMARVYPIVAPLHELRITLAKLRLNDLAVGRDGRNRVLLSAFQARTGRNQPSNAKFIFGPAVWLRGLIQPPPGNGVAYIDWSQQEFGIAAALSGNPLMMEAYCSGDPYLEFAKQAGTAPRDVAAIPAGDFETYLATAHDEQSESTTRMLLGYSDRRQATARKRQRIVGGQVEDLLEFTATGQRMGCIVIDPPWPVLGATLPYQAIEFDYLKAAGGKAGSPRWKILIGLVMK
jgi:hypothetical protein